jgi:hypothetical protein
MPSEQQAKISTLLVDYKTQTTNSPALPICVCLTAFLVHANYLPFVAIQRCRTSLLYLVSQSSYPFPFLPSILLSFYFFRFKARLGLDSDFGFRISDFGFRISDFGFRISDFGFRISDFGFRISDFGFPDFRISGFPDFRISDFRILPLYLPHFFFDS